MKEADKVAKRLLKQAQELEYKWQLDVGRLLNAHRPTFKNQKDFLKWCAVHLNISKAHAYRLMNKARDVSFN